MFFFTEDESDDSVLFVGEDTSDVEVEEDDSDNAIMFIMQSRISFEKVSCLGNTLKIPKPNLILVRRKSSRCSGAAILQNRQLGSLKRI